MGVLVYAIPFVVCLILLIFFRQYMVWWEYVIMVVVSVLLTMFINWCFVSSRECDTEYWGGYMTKITHYDDWDEWIEETCTRTVHDGYDEDGNEITHEEEYDCSYRQYHPERWTYTDDNGNENYFYCETEFNRAMRELGNPKMCFVDMHRHYYTKDGDAQDYYYDGTIQHLRALTTSHTYTNKVNCSNSIFKFEDISDEEADKLGLFRYPEIVDEDQPVILGIKPGRFTHKAIKNINAKYGKTRQIRVYILVFTNKPVDISFKQREYWKGGNKNEFVVCLGYDSETGKVTWCNPFSWSDRPELEVATKTYFRNNQSLNLIKYGKWLENHLDLWSRKEFKDFDYIKNEPTYGQSIALLIIIIIIDIILSIFLIINEYTENGDRESYIASSILPMLHNCGVSIAIKWEEKVIPALTRIEETYKNTFTWK